MGLDVNGYDNQPEWGYCRTEDCPEEAFPVWKQGEYPDDPDLLLCPKHLGLLITYLETQIGEVTETAVHQDAERRRAEADAAALGDVLSQIRALAPPHSHIAARVDAAKAVYRSGAALLAELEAARAVVAEVRWSVERREWAYSAQRKALAAYDAAVKGAKA